MTEGRGERATGTPNTVYDLSSVLFHALEGGARPTIDTFGTRKKQAMGSSPISSAGYGTRTP